MSRRPDPIPSEAIGRETPIRLDIAARLAFPGGGVTAAVLRREGQKK